MRIVIAGGHGQIALLLARQLIARGDQVVSLIRNPDQVSELTDLGAEPAVVNLETATRGEIAEVLKGADAAVFAAGAGAGSGGTRKDTVDRAAATLFAEASVDAGVHRHLQISSMGLDRADDPDIDPVFSLYLKAKAAAEENLRHQGLAWTIVRPGALTNDSGTGLIDLGEHVSRGSISRADVAETLAALLTAAGSVHRTLEVVGGRTSISEAVSAL